MFASKSRSWLSSNVDKILLITHDVHLHCNFDFHEKYIQILKRTDSSVEGLAQDLSLEKNLLSERLT